MPSIFSKVQDALASDDQQPKPPASMNALAGLLHQGNINIEQANDPFSAVQQALASDTKPAPQPEEPGMLSRIGHEVYSGALEAATGFNKLIGLGAFEPTRKAFIEPGQKAATDINQRFKSNSWWGQQANALLRGVGSMGIDIPVQVATGAAAKLATVGTKLAPILSNVPDFVLGAGITGAAKGYKEGGIPKAVTSGAESAIMARLYTGKPEGQLLEKEIPKAIKRASEGFLKRFGRDVSKFAALGAAQVTYEKAKSGTIPTEDELSSSIAQGIGMAVAFQALPLANKIISIPRDRMALMDLEKRVNAAVEDKNLVKAIQHVTDFYNNPKVSDKTKQTVAKAFEAGDQVANEASKHMGVTPTQSPFPSRPIPAQEQPTPELSTAPVSRVRPEASRLEIPSPEVKNAYVPRTEQTQPEPSGITGEIMPQLESLRARLAVQKNPAARDKIAAKAKDNLPPEVAPVVDEIAAGNVKTKADIQQAVSNLRTAPKRAASTLEALPKAAEGANAGEGRVTPTPEKVSETGTVTPEPVSPTPAAETSTTPLPETSSETAPEAPTAGVGGIKYGDYGKDPIQPDDKNAFGTKVIVKERLGPKKWIENYYYVNRVLASSTEKPVYDVYRDKNYPQETVRVNASNVRFPLDYKPAVDAKGAGVVEEYKKTAPEKSLPGEIVATHEVPSGSKKVMLDTIKKAKSALPTPEPIGKNVSFGKPTTYYGRKQIDVYYDTKDGKAAGRLLIKPDRWGYKKYRLLVIDHGHSFPKAELFSDTQLKNVKQYAKDYVAGKTKANGRVTFKTNTGAEFDIINSHRTLDIFADRIKKTPYVKFQLSPKTKLPALTNLRKALSVTGADVSITPDGITRVRYKNGKGFDIVRVHEITPDDVTLETAIGQRALPPGKVIKGKFEPKTQTVTLSRHADATTYGHELQHWIESNGLLSKMEIAALDSGAKKAFGKGGEENRAQYVGEQMANRTSKGRLGKIIQKIADFLDAIHSYARKAFGKGPTAGEVVRGIEKGKVQGRTAAGSDNPDIRYQVGESKADKEAMKKAAEALKAGIEEDAPKDKVRLRAGVRPFMKDATEKIKTSEFTEFVNSLKDGVQKIFTPEVIAARISNKVDPLLGHMVQKETYLRENYARVHENEHKWWHGIPEKARLKYFYSIEDSNPKAAMMDLAGHDIQVYHTLMDMAKAHRETLDGLYKDEVEAGININYRTDYWPHIWEDQEKASQAFAKYRLTVGKDRFAKMRTIDKIKTGVEELKLKLKTTNPEEMIAMRLAAGHRAIIRMEFLHELKRMGIAKDYTQGTPRESGFEWVIYGPKGEMYLTSKEHGEALQAMQSSVDKKVYIADLLDMRKRAKLYRKGMKITPEFSEIVRAPNGKRYVMGAADASAMQGLSDAERMQRITELQNMKKAVRAYKKPTELSGMTLIDFPDGHQYAIPNELEPLLVNAGYVQGKGKSLWVSEDAIGKSYRTLMRAKNLFIPIKLGLSLFHIVHEATIDMSARRVNVYNDIIKRNLGWTEGLKQLARATTGISQVDAVKSGYNIIKAYGKKPEDLTDYQKWALESIQEGGGTPTMSEEWKIRAKDAFNKALAEMRYPGIVWHGIRRILESMQKPIFEIYIPSMKVATFLDEAKRLLARNPELGNDVDARRVEFRKLWKEVDNMYGELAYKTLFWHRVTKDIGVGSLLSMGWQLGFLREFGGAVTDTAKFAKNLVKDTGKAEVSRRMLFAIDYTAQAMVIGALITFALTGKAPQKLLDYFYPNSGEKDLDGTDLRFNTPFYTREFFAASEHIRKQGVIGGMTQMMKNKMNPILSPAFHVFDNKDYYGTDIRDPNASAQKQAEQIAEYLGKETLPISITSWNKSADVMPWLKAAITSVLGFTKAPRYITETPMQKDIFDAYSRYGGSKGRSKTDVAHSQTKRKLRVAILRTGKMPIDDFRAAIASGAFGYGPSRRIQSNVKRFLRTVHLTSDIRAFKGIPTDVQLSLLRKMNKKELARYLRYANGAAKIQLLRGKK